jgi:hypothetical protein
MICQEYEKLNQFFLFYLSSLVAQGLVACSRHSFFTIGLYLSGCSRTEEQASYLNDKILIV